MINETFHGWYRSSSITAYIDSVVKRYCGGNDEDDFKQEAWIRVLALPDTAIEADIKAEAYRGIEAIYRRRLRLRRHEVTLEVR